MASFLYANSLTLQLNTAVGVSMVEQGAMGQLSMHCSLHDVLLGSDGSSVNAKFFLLYMPRFP